MTGEGSAARRDASSAAGGPNWIQATMLPPEVLLIDLRVRVGLAEGTGQYQVEVSDPVTKELLALRSRPLSDGLSAGEALEAASRWAREALAVLFDEDPF